MKLQPRYDGPTVIDIDDPPAALLAPANRQRARFADLLDTLTDDQWDHASRCDGWRVRDVVAHLVSVNEFWSVSITAGLDGAPTRWLTGFDPAASPPQLVAALGDPSPAELRERFAAGNRALSDLLAGLDDEQWSLPAEGPAGHLPIRLIVQHGLWDAWIHERDVALPLGIEPPVEPDEVVACLRFVAALGPALGILIGQATPDDVAVEAHDPPVSFRVAVGGSVALRDGPPAAGVPCLRGPAVELAEALSLRRPLAPDAPPEWARLLAGLAAAFDAT